MTIERRLSLLVAPFAVLACAATTQAASAAGWDGVWTGLLNNKAPIALTIANDKVVSYTIQGAPFIIQYSKLTPTSVTFGDRDHYAVKIVKTGEATAAETAHGRNGFGSASLTKQ